MVLLVSSRVRATALGCKKSKWLFIPQWLVSFPCPRGYARPTLGESPGVLPGFHLSSALYSSETLNPEAERRIFSLFPRLRPAYD